MQDQGRVNINICMGSSCFSRGNNEALATLQEFLESRGLEDSVQISGSLCKGQCESGPIISINGKLYEKVEPSTVVDILKHHISS